MPTYVLPQVLVFQDFQSVPNVVANPLRAHISGGHAYLVRYADEDEREFGRLGYYDNVVDTPYAWPNRPAGGVVDYSYVKLWMKNALLQYFADAAGSGSTIAKVADYNNRIRSATINFAENGEDYPRAAALLDRDVAVGDTAKVRCFPAGEDPVTIWTYVKDLVGDDVPAVIAAATADSGNATTKTQDATAELTDGDANCVVCTPDASAYDGLAAGYPSETYVLKVIEGSVGGDYTTARIRVISASGTDDVSEINPSASGEDTEIGTRGLVVVFTPTGGADFSQSAENEAVSADDLVAGQEFTVTVQQTFTATTATKGGDYSDTRDTTYIIEVVTGGLWADSPQIRVTTTNGVDLSGPTTVTNTGVAVAVGTLGVTVTFGASQGLNKGDRFTIPVTGMAEGPMRTIVLGHNLPTTVLAGEEVDLTLFIRKPLLEITENRTGFAPLVNYEMSETEIQVNSGIVAYDSTWTDNGTAQPLDVVSESDKQYGLLYVEYRAWLPTLCFEVNGMSDVSALDTAITGALTPDNPLKWGVFKALSNSNGVEVKYSSVCEPDSEDSWAGVLELLVGRDDVYGLVPLTRNRTVLDLFAAHVDAMSAADQGLWRVLWVNLAGIPAVPVVSAGSTVSGHLEATTTDGEECLCVFEDDPETDGDQYTIVRCPASNGDFVANGVRAGDVVRAFYVGDGFGNTSYTEYTVDEVQSEDQLRLAAGPDVAQGTPAKIEIWRNLTATEESQALAVEAGTWNNRRVRAVWPDTIESSGTIQEGYHLCAALSGLASGVLPQQGLTNVAIAGFSDVSRTTRKFNRTQLDTMAVAGVWIVTQSLFDGEIYSRHAVTTGDYENIAEREEMVTRNVDSISYRFKDTLAPYIGISNVTPTMEALIAHSVTVLIGVLQSEQSTVQLGGQLISADIALLQPHPTLRDRYQLIINAVIPYPLNTIELHIVV